MIRLRFECIVKVNVPLYMCACVHCVCVGAHNYYRMNCIYTIYYIRSNDIASAPLQPRHAIPHTACTALNDIILYNGTMMYLLLRWRIVYLLRARRESIKNNQLQFAIREQMNKLFQTEFFEKDVR